MKWRKTLKRIFKFKLTACITNQPNLTLFPSSYFSQIILKTKGKKKYNFTNTPATKMSYKPNFLNLPSTLNPISNSCLTNFSEKKVHTCINSRSKKKKLKMNQKANLTSRRAGWRVSVGEETKVETEEDRLEVGRSIIVFGLWKSSTCFLPKRWQLQGSKLHHVPIMCSIHSHPQSYQPPFHFFTILYF